MADDIVRDFLRRVRARHPESTWQELEAFADESPRRVGWQEAVYRHGPARAARRAPAKGR